MKKAVNRLLNRRLKTLLSILIFNLVLSILGGCTTKENMNSTNIDESIHITSIDYDVDYLNSLEIVNKMLIAWLEKDLLMGQKTLSDDYIQEIGEGEVMNFFSGMSNPKHKGFEVMGSEKVNDDTFIFTIWLYTHYRGEQSEYESRPDSNDVEVKRFNESWLITSIQ